MYLISKIRNWIWPSDLQQKDIEAEQQGLGLPNVTFGDRYATFVWTPWMKESIEISDEHQTRRSCSLYLRQMANRRNLIGYVYLDKNILKFIIEK